MDDDRNRFSLTLKPSLVTSGATDASYLHTLLSDLEAADTIRLAHESEGGTGGSGAVQQAERGVGGSGAASGIDWEGSLAIGAVVKGSVHKVEEYGVVVDLEAHQVCTRMRCGRRYEFWGGMGMVKGSVHKLEEHCVLMNLKAHQV